MYGSFLSSMIYSKYHSRGIYTDVVTGLTFLNFINEEYVKILHYFGMSIRLPQLTAYKPHRFASFGTILSLCFI
jgi:hypothetical protein